MDGKIKGRGALSNAEGRFARHVREPDLDALAAAAAADETHEPAKPPTHLHIAHARTIIARNQSPDIPFDQSINPYKGCEHGCIYCYARPTHSYLDLSPGRDFETEIFYKPNAVELLRAELSKPGYRVSPIAFGTNTDPYQPVERRVNVTRGLLELLLERKHPLTIVTKGSLILRDLELLRALAEHELALDLQPNDEEEQRHQPVVDPMLQRMLESQGTGREADRHLPEAEKRRRERRVGQ